MDDIYFLCYVRLIIIMIPFDLKYLRAAYH